jgi:hypothetical protein
VLTKPDELDNIKQRLGYKDNFIKSLQFALLVIFDPAEAGQFWVPWVKRSLPILHQELSAKGDQNKPLKDFLRNHQNWRMIHDSGT